jgi:hypothetical protein
VEPDKYPFSVFFYGPLRFDGNIAESLKAEEPYPLSTIVGSDLAGSLHAGRYQDAINELEKTLTMDPGLVPAHGYLSEAYSILGNAAKAAGEREGSPATTARSTSCALVEIRIRRSTLWKRPTRSTHVGLLHC